MSDVTQILNAIDQGDPHAAAELLPLVYEELRRLARNRMGQEATGHSLDATGLVHEAYLRLVGATDVRPWDGRRHFFAAAAEAMRRILIDRARHKGSLKHGGGRQRFELNDLDVPDNASSDEVLALHDALDRLQVKDPVKAELVKLRFFAGLSNAQAAAMLGISASTADNYWAYARCWLRLEVEGGPA